MDASARLSVPMHPAIQHLRHADPVLSALIDRAGPFTIDYHPPVFATLARSIVSQQLSGRAAATIWARLAAAARPRRITPAFIASLSSEQLRACGLSTAKSPPSTTSPAAAPPAKSAFAPCPRCPTTM
jgi:DNA-3-methyladenine glycosylase II